MASISLKYKSKQGSLTAPGDVDPGAMIPIATATANGSSTFVEFTNIPSSYEHLQVRYIVRSSRSANDDDIWIRYNGDTGSNYARHQLYADGSTVYTFAASSTSLNELVIAPGANLNNDIVAGGVLDILDYANTSKYKTVRSLGGFDMNGTNSWLMFASGLWQSTSAINSIRFLSSNGANLAADSTFALYGIKRAGA